MSRPFDAIYENGIAIWDIEDGVRPKILPRQDGRSDSLGDLGADQGPFPEALRPALGIAFSQSEIPHPVNGNRSIIRRRSRRWGRM
jgi:hypothetical protein